MSEKLAPTKRFRVVQGDQTVYEWDQTIEDVNLYIQLPPGVRSSQLSVTIKMKHLTMGIKGNPPYLDHDLAGNVRVDASFWTIEDGVLHITLQKLEVAAPWSAALLGHELPAFHADQEARRLMLERFQAEHGGFDFSAAELTGACPDPGNFMGGPRSS